MTEQEFINTHEQKERQATTCPCCGNSKDKGLLECWSCWRANK